RATSSATRTRAWSTPIRPRSSTATWCRCRAGTTTSGASPAAWSTSSACWRRAEDMPEATRQDGTRSVAEIDVDGRRVFVRVDFNVPIEDGKITDDTRIRAAIPTIQLVMANGGRPVLASHLGRPKGKPNPEFSLEPAGARLAELLNAEVLLADDCIGDGP